MSDPGSAVQVVNMEALLSRLLNNEYIPEEIKDEWWLLLSDDVTLTNFDDKAIAWQMNKFDLLHLRTIASLHGHAYNKQVVKLINALEMIYHAKLNRARNGFTANNLVKQISEQYLMDRTASSQVQNQNQGLWGHIKGLVGRG